ncbi:MAG: prop effector [Candidatus Saccharibacteria bacterium]|nr:prop effector [Rhodoferax sp.]
MTETLADTPIDTLMETPVVAPATPEPAAAAPTRKPAGAAARIQGSLPTLEKLAQLYPTLFGAVFLPMKRGIFQDLLSAHPEQFERDALKAALSVHTRSTRYLNAVASGQDRHDLQGLAVEPMAPEHVYQSLLEVFRRRQAKAGEDLSVKLRQRIVQAFVATCLPREAYTALVQSKDETANANLEQAMAEAAEWDAKDEATRRAFEASGLAVQAFAEMYGLHPRAVADALSRATRWTQD